MPTKTIYGAGAISLGTGPGEVPVLDESSNLPAVGGANLTGVSGGVTENIYRRINATTGASTFGDDMQTLIAASSAGDVVEMVVGTQQDKTITLKNGVNLRYLPGTVISLTTAISAFTDNGAAVTCIIDGGLPTVNATDGTVFTLSHASSNVTASLGVVTGTAACVKLANVDAATLTLSILGKSRWVNSGWLQLTGGAKFYFTFNELEVSEYAYIGDAQFYPTGKKLWSSAPTMLFFMSNDGGTPITRGKIDQLITTSASAVWTYASMFVCRNGSMQLEADLIQSAGDSCFTGDWEGNVTIKGARIISTKDHADYGVAIRMRAPGGTPGKFTLDNCTVISAGASAVNSISGTGDVYVNGPVIANKDKAATITVKGGTFSFSSDVA